MMLIGKSTGDHRRNSSEQDLERGEVTIALPFLEGWGADMLHPVLISL